MDRYERRQRYEIRGSSSSANRRRRKRRYQRSSSPSVAYHRQRGSNRQRERLHSSDNEEFGSRKKCDLLEARLCARKQKVLKKKKEEAQLKHHKKVTKNLKRGGEQSCILKIEITRKIEKPIENTKILKSGTEMIMSGSKNFKDFILDAGVQVYPDGRVPSKSKICFARYHYNTLKTIEQISHNFMQEDAYFVVKNAIGKTGRLIFIDKNYQEIKQTDDEESDDIEVMYTDEYNESHHRAAKCSQNHRHQVFQNQRRSAIISKSKRFSTFDDPRQLEARRDKFHERYLQPLYHDGISGYSKQKKRKNTTQSLR